MKRAGLRWKPLKGCFIPLESAIAQMLLRITVKDFDYHIGPIFKDYPKASGESSHIRCYNSFNSGKYAVDLQKQLNETFIEDECKPLLLGLAVWVDKSPLNAGMT